MVISVSNAQRRKILLSLSARNREIIRQYSNGHTLREIAEPLSVTHQAVANVIKRAIRKGLLPPKRKSKIRSKADKNKVPREDNSERNTRILSLLTEGLSCGEIAVLVGVTRSTVCGVQYREKQKIRDKSSLTKKAKITRDKNKPVRNKPLPKYPNIMDFKV